LKTFFLIAYGKFSRIATSWNKKTLYL